jgi:hypothetical protein
MNRGQRVLVRAYPDKTLERIVWQECETYVIVCRPEVYESVARLDTLPDCAMGFPKEDVTVVLEN